MTDGQDRADELLSVRGPALRRRALTGAAVLAAVLVATHVLSLGERGGAYLETARGAGLTGLLLHGGAYVLAALLGIPISPLTIAAGATYGVVAGAALAVPSSTLGACCAFLVGRLLVARDPEALARGQGRIARAARAIGRGGLRLVLLLRLVPIVPFSVLNFAFGATPTRLSRFAAGSFLGSIPSQLGYACLGAILTLSRGGGRGGAEIALFAAAVALSVVGTAGAVAVLRGEARRKETALRLP